MPAKTQHPRIVDQNDTKKSEPKATAPKEDIEQLSQEELKKDPEAQAYLNDADKQPEPSNQENPEVSAEPSQEDVKAEEKPVEEPKKDDVQAAPVAPQAPAIDLNSLGKNGGEGLVALVSLITQLQSQVSTLQAQMASKVDSNRVDPKVFLVSGADVNDKVRHESKKDRMKANLAAQPKVPIFIPLEGKEKVGQASLPVTMNGYRLNVPKGIYIDVPKQIGEEIRNSLNQTAQALENAFRLDNDPNINADKKAALEL